MVVGGVVVVVGDVILGKGPKCGQASSDQAFMG